MQIEKLYKQTSTGKIQVWWMEQNGGSYRTHSGIDGGKIVTSAWTECEAKNVGRSNETSPEEQARLEINSSYELKRKKGYRETPDAAEKSDRFQCMLAKKWDDYKDRIDFNTTFLLTQPKLDGIRCIATREGLKSREGNPFSAVPHIEAAVKQFFLDNPGVNILDGELYNHELKEDFNSIISLVKKSKPTAEDLRLSEEMIQYHVYDMIWESTFYATFDARFYSAKTVNGPKSFIHLVDTHHVVNQQEMDFRYGQYLSMGYEGQMIRFGDSKYDHKRSSSLLKRKEFQDAEYTVVAILEGQGNGKGYAKRAVCMLPNNETFTADIVGTQAILAELLANRQSCVGRKATVIFQNLTPVKEDGSGGVPRFPKLKVVHQKGW